MLAGMSAALIALILIVLFMAFGFGLLGFALSVFWTLIWYSIVGLVIGGLGRLLVSGRQQLGLVETALFGIAGALLGGIVANDILDGFVGRESDDDWSLRLRWQRASRRRRRDLDLAA